MRGRKLFVALLLICVAACEPLAPEVTQQVIVVTNQPSATAIQQAGNFVPPSPTGRPTIPPTLTPTTAIIPTGTVPPCNEDEGAYFESSYDSEIAGDAVPYNIYLPPCFFESGRRFPYVVLMHGSGFDFTQWDDLGIEAALNEGITAQTLAPMVVVMPEGGVAQEANVFEAGASYADMIVNELIPSLERDYCLWSENRAIGGISRGAFWAFNIAFRNPNLFTSVGGHSPIFVPDNAPASDNPLALAENAIGIENLRIYLDNAQSDSGGPNVIVFSNSLRTRGIDHTYIINPEGGHNNNYWSANLQNYLAFYAEAWPLQVAELPSCQ